MWFNTILEYYELVKCVELVETFYIMQGLDYMSNTFGNVWFAMKFTLQCATHASTYVRTGAPEKRG